MFRVDVWFNFWIPERMLLYLLDYTKLYETCIFCFKAGSKKQMVTIIVSVVFLKKKALNFVRRDHVICFYKVKLPPMFKNKVQWLKDCLWMSFLKSCFISYSGRKIRSAKSFLLSFHEFLSVWAHIDRVSRWHMEILGGTQKFRILTRKRDIFTKR